MKISLRYSNWKWVKSLQTDIGRTDTFPPYTHLLHKLRSVPSGNSEANNTSMQIIGMTLSHNNDQILFQTQFFTRK